MLGVLLAATLATADPPEVYNGRLNRTEVRVPRLSGRVRIDGVLDEPVWQQAALLTGFSQFQPNDGVAAEDSTEVLIFYDEHEIRLGVRAFEPHGVVHASLPDRDHIGADDYIEFLLDTFNDHRRALVFSVNPFGVQADGVMADVSGSDLNPGLDLSPDFVFESKGRLTDFGYEVEIRIPFKSLRYQPDKVQTWGINILRGVQHSGYLQTWTPARRDRASFLAQSGTLTGLTDLRRGLVLDANPVITARTDGAPDSLGRWQYDGQRPEPGLNLRWGVSANLTMNATLNPDFSQVESDASQLTFDPRQALFFPEKRPFFLEASENFSTPNRLIYTRRIVSPVGAAKFTGKVSGTDLGVLSAVDDDALSASGAHPVFNLLRIRRDIGHSSTVGLAYTDRVEGSDYNRVAATDARLVFGDKYALSLQAGASFTRTDAGANAWRPIFTATGAVRDRHFGLATAFQGIHNEFVAAAGFVNRAGIAHANVRPAWTFYGRRAAFIENYTQYVNLDGTWTWDHFTAGDVPDDQKFHVGGDFTLRGGWHTGYALLLESFKYPVELYTNYFIDTGTDTVPYVGVDRIANYDAQFTLATPQYKTFSANAFLIGGRDENFFEWSKSWVLLATLSAQWRPTDKARITGNYVLQRYQRFSDGSSVGLRQIPRLKLEYQVARPLFLRLVGEYDANRQADLRDDSRTERPILLCDAGATDCVPAAGYRRARFRADWLLSYQPTPGTVVFLGYGSSMGADATVSLHDLRRTSDGFFIKLSYLMRF